MATKKFTDLSNKATAGATDILPIVDPGDNTSKRTTVGGLITALLSVIPGGSIVTAMLANGAVTAGKIDFTTFTHIEAMGSFTTGNISSNSSANFTVTIPTQADTNYRVLMTIGTTGGTYWTFLVPRTLSKSTGSFQAQVWNNGPGTATATSIEYLVVRSS